MECLTADRWAGDHSPCKITRNIHWCGMGTEKSVRCVIVWRNKASLNLLSDAKQWIWGRMKDFSISTWTAMTDSFFAYVLSKFNTFQFQRDLSRLMTQPIKWPVRTAKTQIGLGIHESDQSSLCTQWVPKDPRFLQTDSEVSDQTGWMPRLIWVFAGCTGHFVMRQLISLHICHMGHVKRIWYLSPMRAAKVQASLRIRAVSPEPPLLAHISSESRGTFRQKARSLAPLNDWACAVKICHDGMLEDTNSLDVPHINTVFKCLDDTKNITMTFSAYTHNEYHRTCRTTKPTKWCVASEVTDQPGNLPSLYILYAVSEDSESDQTGWMHRLICILLFANGKNRFSHDVAHMIWQNREMEQKLIPISPMQS